MNYQKTIIFILSVLFFLFYGICYSNDNTIIENIGKGPFDCPVFFANKKFL